MRQVVVVGGGMAGCWAAATAARGGARVTLVRRSAAATAVSSGAIDFVPPAEAADPGTWLRRLPREDPAHPYLADGQPPSLAALQEEASRLAASLAAAGLPHRADLESPALVAAVDGRRRHAGMLAGTAATGDLRSLDRVAVAGVAGLRRLDARLVATAVGAEVRGGAEPIVVEAPGLPEVVRDDLDDATVARAVEAPGGAEALGTAIRSALAAGAAGGVAAVLLPAVLGLEDPAAVTSRVSAAAGVPVAEMLTPPPSVPGWRLHHALERVAVDAGVEVVAGRVVGVAVDGRRAVAVETEGGAAVACDVLVLATGKYLGGGVGGAAGRAGLHETLLDLPLFVGDVPVTDLSYRDLSVRTAFTEQPFLEAGVRVDAAGRPVDRFGAAVLDNVLACGALLAGMTATLRAGGLGVVAWTGARAGRTAAAAAGIAAA